MKKLIVIFLILMTSCKNGKSTDKSSGNDNDCECKLLETKECNIQYKMYKMEVTRSNGTKDTIWIKHSSETNAKDFCNNFCPTVNSECNIGTESHKEGNDQAYYDEQFWKDYEKKFTVSDLPTYNNFNNAYPKSDKGGCMEAKEVFKLIGGELLNSKFENACATRVSRALNYSGINIPSLKKENGDKLTFKGQDDKYYFVGAEPLFKWLKKEFGEPNFVLNASQVKSDGSGFKIKVAENKGIYVMIPRYPGTNYFNASGHTEIFNGNCNCDCYFDPKGGLDSANLWVLEENAQF